ncbi:NUDIX domain-containing protein [Deinococcus daejeonensis]|uniref:DNA mismatch repair protein MutT n=1 Tax=Deinococcus daejeonensis TaxID=1007098 RepID=A0ABQ2J6Y9_9DEIO|nr:NUDIX domain-containing protein [Deinococcus daejeonensis]GGN39195.1 DNA mismatch repair protein MutT [Deinococcus daejeonensis]
MSREGYVRDLPALIGPRPVNLIGVAALITDPQGHLLLARRVNAGRWGLSELGEAADDTLRREVHEESRLTVKGARLIDLLVPAGLSEAPNGDQFSAYTAAYRVTGWHGTPQPDGHELADLRFFPRTDLPHLPLTRLGQAALAWTA